MRTKTRGQQEIIGFALIVVIVTVISLIFLILYLKKPVTQENVEVENLLASTMDFTTQCVINPPTYETMEDLIKTCALSQGKRCKNGDDPCEYLTRLEKDILSSAKKTDNLMNGYQLDINLQNKAVIPKIFEGNCSSDDRIIGSQRLIRVGDSQISIRLALCYMRA